jgi:glycosyltransferase involved in cell wall biosynthesis
MNAILDARLEEQSGIPAATTSLRIALIAPFLNKSATGLSTYIADLVPQLCDAGHQVSIIGTDCGYRGEEAGELVEVDSRANLRVFPVRGRLNRRFYRCAEMSRWLNSAVREFDIIDIQGVWTSIAIDAACACLSGGVPYVITPHATMTRWDWSKNRHWKRVFFATRLRKVWREAAAIRFLSHGELKNSMVPPATPFAVIANAVQPPAADKTRTAKRDVCARLGLPPNATLVLFLGRVTDQKGVMELLQAFAVMQERCPDAYLVIAGPLDGEYGNSVKKLASVNARRVRLLGPVFGSDKNDLFESASLFVTLSKNEGLPIAVLEALSFGVPVVLTAESNLPEVEDFGAGTITTCEPERAAGAISAMLLDPVKLGQIRVGAKRMIQQRFSWNFVLPQLVQLYQRAATQAATKTR